jgi:hypothetical protein
VGGSLVKTRSRNVPVALVNTSREPQLIRKGTTIGVIKPVLSASPINDNNMLNMLQERNGEETVSLATAKAEVIEEEGKESSGSKPDSQLPKEYKSKRARLDPALIADHLKVLMEGISKELNLYQREEIAAVLEKYKNQFSTCGSDIGRNRDVLHEINTGDSRPIRNPPRRMNLQKQKIEEEEVAKMLDKGVIEPSRSPWASPIVLATKKDGTTRFCIDYRRLNEVTVKDSFPLPRIDDTLDSLKGSMYFSTLDLASGYWQIEMNPQDIEKTAFITRQGLFQWKVMPFGLCNAPATFQRLMQVVLHKLNWKQCLVYIDDIIIYGSSFDVCLDNQCIRKVRNS